MNLGKPSFRWGRAFSKQAWARPTSAQYYTFLDTLSEDDPALWSAAQESIDLQGLNAQSKGEVEARLQSAVDFLQNLMVNERAKEKNFLIAHKDALPKRYQNLSSLDDIDYPTLINAINTLISGEQAYQQILQNEKTRQLNAQQRAQGTKVRPIKTTTQAFQNYANGLLNSLRDSGMNRKGRAVEIREKIWAMINEKVNAGNINITSDDDLMALFTAVFEMNIAAIQLFEGTNGTANLDQITESSSFMGIYDSLIKAYEDNSKTRAAFVARMKKNFADMGFEQDLSKNMTEGRRKLKNPYQTAKEGFSNELKSVLTKMKDFTIHVAVNSKKGRGAMAEILGAQGLQGLQSRVSNAIIRSFDTGSTKTVTDVIGYETILPLDIQISASPSVCNQVDDVIQDTVNNNLRFAHEDYIEQNQLMWKNYERIQSILDQHSAASTELVNCFTFHENVKDYNSFAGQKGIDGVWAYDSFSGGTEWQLAPFMKFLSAIGEVGISSEDIALIEQSILNTVPGSVMQNNKNPIENFISIFISLTLFSDGLTMAWELAQGLISDTSSLNRLHLFYVNNVYVPSSVVLE